MKEPVFVLSCMRSYSSVVCGMLGQHPALYSLPEINLLVADGMRQLVNTFRLVRPASLSGLLRTIAQLEFGEQTEAAVDNARQWITERLDWSTRQMYYHIAERVEPLRCVDKCPITVMSKEYIKRSYEYFPNARYLHLIRHPRPTCQSIAKIIADGDRKRGTDRAANTDPEAIWLRSNSNCVAFSTTVPPGRMMAIQGEQILGEPDLYLAQIAEFLGLEGNPESIEAMKHPERSPYACIGPANAPFGGDPNFLKNPRFEQRPIPIASLDGPPDWPGRVERSGFSPETVQLARQFGYQ